MTRAYCGSALAIDSANELLGILTERDQVEGVMAKSLDPAGAAMAKMMPPHLRCLPAELRASDALPRELNTAVDLAEFHERVNVAMG